MVRMTSPLVMRQRNQVILQFRQLERQIYVTWTSNLARIGHEVSSWLQQRARSKR